MPDNNYYIKLKFTDLSPCVVRPHCVLQTIFMYVFVMYARILRVTLPRRWTSLTLDLQNVNNKY